MQSALKHIYIIAPLLVVWLAGVPVMARADVAAENACMQQHINKIIPAYRAAKAGDVMEPWVETETLRQLARGYAFLGDEARMQETLAQVPIIKQRGTLLYPYMDLMLARLQAGDVAGVFDLFKNIKKAVATVNTPARDWAGKDPAPINDPDDPLGLFNPAALQRQMEDEIAAPLEIEDFKNRYCQMAAEHWAAAERMDLLDRLGAEVKCPVLPHKAAMFVRQGKLIEALDILKQEKTYWIRRKNGQEVRQEEPFSYRYDTAHYFDMCRAAPATPDQIKYFTGLTDVPPLSILIVLMELEAYDAAYVYALEHMEKILQQEMANEVLADLYGHLFVTQQKHKLQKLSETSILTADFVDVQAPENDYTPKTWRLSPEGLAKILSKKPDAFSLEQAMRVKKGRKRFTALSGMYFFIQEADKDSFPDCKGNTRACVFQEMARIADVETGPMVHFPQSHALQQHLMYAILAEIARIEGYEDESDRFLAKIPDPNEKIVPWGSHIVRAVSFLEAAQLSLWNSVLEAKGRDTLNKIFPPKHDRPSLYNNVQPSQTKAPRPHKNPLLLRWVHEADQDMRKSSWRYNMATLYHLHYVHRPSEKAGRRCLLDARRLPPEGWPENQK